MGNKLESYEKHDVVLCRDSPISKGLPTSILQQYPYGLCLTNQKLPIGGSFDEEKTSYMTLTLVMCNNATSNVTCKPQSEIENFFIYKKINYMITDNLLALTSDEFDFNTEELFKILIYFTNKETYITKKYVKIQDVLGVLGGIVNGLISVLYC